MMSFISMILMISMISTMFMGEQRKPLNDDNTNGAVSRLAEKYFASPDTSQPPRACGSPGRHLLLNMHANSILFTIAVSPWHRTRLLALAVTRIFCNPLTRAWRPTATAATRTTQSRRLPTGFNFTHQVTHRLFLIKNSWPRR